MKILLKEEDRDQLLAKLTADQLTFLAEHVKRGKRSKFANEMAKSKGITITENMTESEIERLLEDWILVDFIDAGKVSKSLRCQCGRALRYQYIVKNLSSGEILTFGREHFQEHTNLPPSIVKQVLKGLEEIDYERDEILFKVARGWKLQNELPFLEDIQIPEDILKHIESGLPLLEWQTRKLHKLYQDVVDEQHTRIHDRKHRQQQVDLFSFQQGDLFEEASKDRIESGLSIDNSSAGYSSMDDSAIHEYVEEGIESARVICELLIRNNGWHDKRYVTGKPIIYYRVCLYLDQLVQLEQLQLKQSNLQDRSYRKN